MWHFRPIISWNLPVNHKHRQPFWSFYRVITDKFTLFPSDQCTGPRLLVTRGCCITSPFLSLSTPSHVTILSLSPFSRDCCILSPSFSPPLLTWLLYPVTPLLYPVAHSFSRDCCILSPPSLPTPSHVSVVSCRPLLLTWLLYPVTSSLPTPSHVTDVSCSLSVQAPPPLFTCNCRILSLLLPPSHMHATVVSCRLFPHPPPLLSLAKRTRKLTQVWTCIQLAFLLATHLRRLALTCVDFGRAHIWTQV